MLIEEYFQSIGIHIADCPYKVIESFAPRLGEVLQEIQGILILPWDSD